MIILARFCGHWELNGKKPRPETVKSLDSGDTESMDNETDDLEKMPAALPDPHGVAFTDEQLAALTDVSNEEAVKLAFAKATPEMRVLATARPINNE